MGLHKGGRPLPPRLGCSAQYPLPCALELHPPNSRGRRAAEGPCPQLFSVISTGRSVKLKGPVTSRVAWALALSTTRPCDAAKDLHSPALDNQAQGRPSSPMGPTMRQVSTTGPRPAPSWRQAGRFPLKWTLGRRLPLCATARRRLPLRAWHVNTTPPTMATSPQGGLLADGQQRWRRQPGDGQVQQARRAPVRLQLPCLVVCLSHQ